METVVVVVGFNLTWDMRGGGEVPLRRESLETIRVNTCTNLRKNYYEGCRPAISTISVNNGVQYFPTRRLRMQESAQRANLRALDPVDDSRHATEEDHILHPHIVSQIGTERVLNNRRIQMSRTTAGHDGGKVGAHVVCKHVWKVSIRHPCQITP